MGYEFHITRKEHWSDPDDHNIISFEEWFNYANNDPELEIDVQNGPGFFFWTAHPERKGEASYWINYNKRDGDIHSKRPDDATIDKMVSIAKALNAKVQGDDGELYGVRTHADAITSPDINEIRERLKAKAKLKPKPWWKFW